MTTNADTDATWAYHNATKHTWASVRSGGHVLDHTNQPRPYKLYRDVLPEVVLANSVVASGRSGFDMLHGQGPVPVDGAVPSLAQLNAVLLLSAGVTKHLPSIAGSMRFRAAACTGALYHIELYVVTGDTPDLPAGIYHFGVHDNALRRIRDGDHRAALAAAAGDEPFVATAPLSVVYTTTYWRNAWKYQARAYRHAYWDGGTIIANTLAVAGANRLRASVVTGFVDDSVNVLLGLDPDHEAAIALVPLGGPGDAPEPGPDASPLALDTEPLSHHEVDYPAIREMHSASSLSSLSDVREWRASGVGPRKEPAADLTTLVPSTSADKPLEATIVRRGSSRRFEREPISLDSLAAVLTTADHPVPLDSAAYDSDALTSAYVIVNAVDGLASGVYLYHRGQGLELLRSEDTRIDAAHLDLDQELAGDAAVNVYFTADLNTLLPSLGNRAYRAAHLDASIAAGRMYLAAYASGLGATGLTFYDDEVIDYLSPSAAGESVMFLIAIGVPGRRQPVGAH
jgi:SagB-type dehydrogenase family enzyme